MNRILAALAVALSVAFAPAGPARAQDLATLVAERVEIRADSTLVAEGAVEVFWRGARLTARRILYDRAADRLVIEGPITLTDGGEVALFADQAELSADLQDGILSSARLVLAEQLQLAAVEIARVGGRFTDLDRVVTSSCQVCPGQPEPLWSIRARRVIHDQQERQIYFEQAQFRIAGVPVFYLPRLRFPDPTLSRARGLLFPRVRSTSALGTGVKLPYFFPIGASADLTVVPYLSARTTTVELRYRQAFRRGDIEFNGAVSRDSILPEDTRYYLFGTGAFDAPRGFRLGFGLQLASDDAYLLDYGYGDHDRLESSVWVNRTRRGEHIGAEVLAFRTLRGSEPNSTQPTLVSTFVRERRFVPGGIGGIATLRFETLTAYRNAPTDVLGRDVARAAATATWERTEVFGPGVVATGTARLAAELYGVAQDSAFPGWTARAVPETAVTLRWPLSRAGADGATYLLEPVAALAFTPRGLRAVPNEDSFVTEFDEGNLLGLSRFPGTDRREEGLRLALGLGWTRVSPSGWTARLTFGRIFREEGLDTLGPGTGLSGTASDWLAVAAIELPNRLDLTTRALIDDDLTVRRADIRIGYEDTRFSIDSGLLLLEPAPAEGRDDRVAEWAMDADWRISAAWTGRAAWRYDFEAHRATSAGFGLGWENECARVDLSLSRRFTSSTSVRPTTDFGLSVELTGFGTGGESRAPRRRCMN
jgi:LPS-assembly protein